MGTGPAEEWDVTREWIDRLKLETPEDRIEYVRMLARHLHRTEEPDDDLCGEIGVGPLEGLLFEHEEELWPELERLARDDVRFRRALSSVWAYGSPMFDRREALLAELGESPVISVSFTGIPLDFSEPPLLDWRAVEISGPVAMPQLARLLREIADWAERRDGERQDRVVDERHLRDHWYAWSGASQELERARHALGVETHPKRAADHVRRIDEARQLEAARWHALRSYL